MENESQITESKQRNSWPSLEQEELIKILTIVCEGQNEYGKEHNIKSIFQYFKFKLEGKLSVGEIVYALNKHTDQKNSIPTPADIMNLLNPEPPKISQAEYIQACKEYEANGYNNFSDAFDVKKAYEAQEKNKRENFKIECEEIKALVSKSVKRIS